MSHREKNRALRAYRAIRMQGSHIGESAARMTANKNFADSFWILRLDMAKSSLLTEIAVLS